MHHAAPIRSTSALMIIVLASGCSTTMKTDQSESIVGSECVRIAIHLSEKNLRLQQEIDRVTEIETKEIKETRAQGLTAIMAHNTNPIVALPMLPMDLLGGIFVTQKDEELVSSDTERVINRQDATYQGRLIVRSLSTGRVLVDQDERMASGSTMSWEDEGVTRAAILLKGKILDEQDEVCAVDSEFDLQVDQSKIVDLTND